MLGAVDLAAGSIQISLKISAFRAVQSISGSAVDALLGADGGLVAAQPVQLAAREIPVLPAVSDAPHLTVLPGIDPSFLRCRRLILRERTQGTRERDSKGNGDDTSNQHASSFRHWLTD
jgi:hypothetical protein